MHIVSTSLVFLNGSMKIPKNCVDGETNFLKNYQGKSGVQRENAKFVGVMGFFHFSLLTTFTYL